MRVAVIGSRNLYIQNIGKFLPKGTSELLSGGAAGTDESARDYAREQNIPITEYFPDYARYGRSAPIVRNRRILEEADAVVAFWDGESRGTEFGIEYAKKKKKPLSVLIILREFSQKHVFLFVYSYKKSIFEKNFRKIGNTFRFQTVIISVRE